MNHSIDVSADGFSVYTEYTGEGYSSVLGSIEMVPNRVRRTELEADATGAAIGGENPQVWLARLKPQLPTILADVADAARAREVHNAAYAVRIRQLADAEDSGYW